MFGPVLRFTLIRLTARLHWTEIMSPLVWYHPYLFLTTNKNGPPNPLLTLCLISLIAFSCPHVADDKQIIMPRKKVAIHYSVYAILRLIICLLSHIAKVSIAWWLMYFSFSLWQKSLDACISVPSNLPWTVLLLLYSFTFVKDIPGKNEGMWW